MTCAEHGKGQGREAARKQGPVRPAGLGSLLVLLRIFEREKDMTKRIILGWA